MYAAIGYRYMRPKQAKVIRATAAVTRWLPLSAAGAAITFVIGFVLQLPLYQLITATAMTGVLVFSGLAMRSYGKEREDSV
jgi:hypothetical protein